MAPKSQCILKSQSAPARSKMYTPVSKNGTFAAGSVEADEDFLDCAVLTCLRYFEMYLRLSAWPKSFGMYSNRLVSSIGAPVTSGSSPGFETHIVWAANIKGARMNGRVADGEDKVMAYFAPNACPWRARVTTAKVN